MTRTVIVGGSRGMGLALARRLVAVDHEVVITGRDEARLAQAAAQIGSRAQSISFDMTDEGAVQGAFATLGGFDHLVLCGSDAVAWGSLQDVSAQRLTAALNGKLVGYWNCMRAATASGNRLSPTGSITLLGGAAARAAMPGTSALAAVNGAITRAAMTWAVELAPRRVNVVSPGLTATHAYDAMPRAQREAFFAERGHALPVGRVGSAEEIAQTIHLAIDNGFMTGAVLDVDGGARWKFY